MCVGVCKGVGEGNEGNNHFLFLDCLPSQIILERDFLEIGDYLIYLIS